MATFPTPLALIGRVLSFRFDAADLEQAQGRHLLVGLLFTWLAGIGRYWDNPRVTALQQAGVGSLAYVFLLSGFLWLLFYPLRPKRWSYFALLTFITAVAPPAWVYAIPVERFMALDTARMVNFVFLGLVATWRVSLYAAFLRRYAELSGARFVVAWLLPLALIVFALTVLNLERAVFEIMAGNNRQPGTSADTAYMTLFLLSALSIGLTPVLVITYVVVLFQARQRPTAQPLVAADLSRGR